MSSLDTLNHDTWSIIADGCFTDQIEAHYRTLLFDLDLACYNNCHDCHVPGSSVAFYKAMGYMALTLPSVAYIDPHRTREVEYNLNLTAKNISNPNLSNPLDMYDSCNVRLILDALSCEMYRLVSGRKQFDEKADALIESIQKKFDRNYQSSQKIFAIETVVGRFEMFPNLLAMLVFQIHDEIHGTRYSMDNDRIFDGLNAFLLDDVTGLYFESLQSGSFGFDGQALDPRFFWVVKNIRPSSNALALNLMHYFRPQEAEALWPLFKTQFGEKLLEINLNDMKGNSGKSFLTPLGFAQEDLFASLWVAKEMGDVEFFNLLRERLHDVCMPKRIEAKIFYDQLESDGPLISYFSLLAQCHVGWKRLIEKDWSQTYHKDYILVR
jgi:hypothetical protein